MRKRLAAEEAATAEKKIYNRDQLITSKHRSISTRRAAAAAVTPHGDLSTATAAGKNAGSKRKERSPATDDDDE